MRNSPPYICGRIGRGLTGSSNTQWALHLLQLALLDETRVRNKAHIHSARLSHVPHNILGTEAVPNSADPLGARRLPDVLDERLGDGLDLLDAVRLPRVLAGEPVHYIEVRPAVHRDGVALEHIRRVGSVAVLGKNIGQELHVVEFVPEHVGDYEEGDVWVGFA